MTTDGEYYSVAGKQPEYNFLEYRLILTARFGRVMKLNSVV
jgi:hypothetical protein